VRPHHVKCSNYRHFVTPCKYSAGNLRDWTVWSAVSVQTERRFTQPSLGGRAGPDVAGSRETHHQSALCTGIGERCGSRGGNVAF
jgi:hypothetical protein